MDHIDPKDPSKGGRSILPMPVLDGIVLNSLEERIFAPDRLEALLRGCWIAARNKTTVNASKAKDQRKVEGRIEPLYAALADGTVGAAGPIPYLRGNGSGPALV